MKIYALPLYLLLFLVTASCNFQNKEISEPEAATILVADSPKNLMFKARIAIENRDNDALKKLIITDSIRTPEMANALSELLIEQKSGKYAQFWKEHSIVLKDIDFNLPTKSGSILFKISLLPPFSNFAMDGEYLAQENLLRYQYPTSGDSTMSFTMTPFELELKRTDDGFKFWPTGVPNSLALIYTNQIIQNLPKVVMGSTRTIQKENFKTLLKTYVKPTSLAYDNKNAKGKIKGKKWELKAGVAYQEIILEKYTYLIYLTNVELEDATCKNLNSNVDKFQLLITEPGEYDLAFDDCQLTIQKKQINKEITASGNAIVDGKVAFRSTINATSLREKLRLN